MTLAQMFLLIAAENRATAALTGPMLPDLPVSGTEEFNSPGDLLQLAAMARASHAG